MTEAEKRDLVGTIIVCPRDICESGKLKIWGYHPVGNPNHFKESREHFNVKDASNTESESFILTLEEFESWL